MLGSAQGLPQAPVTSSTGKSMNTVTISNNCLYVSRVRPNLIRSDDCPLHRPAQWEIGEFHQDARHGKGVLHTPSFSYDGAWALDKMHGRGTLTTGDGGVHTGQFKKGVLFFTSGWRALRNTPTTTQLKLMNTSVVILNVRVKNTILVLQLTTTSVLYIPHLGEKHGEGKYRSAAGDMIEGGYRV